MDCLAIVYYLPTFGKVTIADEEVAVTAEIDIGLACCDNDAAVQGRKCAPTTASICEMSSWLSLLDGSEENALMMMYLMLHRCLSSAARYWVVLLCHWLRDRVL